MSPVHIYFKEIDIDQNQSFTINFAKEIKNVLFDGQNEYAVSRMNIKLVLKNENIIKVEKQKQKILAKRFKN